MSDTMRDEAGEGALIPALPDEVALLCLARIPRVKHAMLSRVCQAWRNLFRGDELFTIRSKLQYVDRWFLVLGERPFPFCSYDLESKKRSPLPLPDDVDRVTIWTVGGFKCVAVGSYFVVIGGVVIDLAGVHGQSMLSMFDSISQRWSKGANMLVPRCYFARGVIGGKLYVAGGFNGCGESEVSGEVYNFKTNEWSSIAPMPIRLAHIESDAVFKDRLVIKGRATLEEGDQRKVLCYDPVNNTWENSEKLERGLLDGEFVATADELYLMNRSNYIGKYDEESAEWKQVGIICPYFLPFDCPLENCVGFGKLAMFLNTLDGERMDLCRCSMVHQVLHNVYWLWEGAIVEA